MQEGVASARSTAFAAPLPCCAKPGLRTRVRGLCLRAEAKFESAGHSVADAEARLQRVKQYAAVFREEGVDGEVRKFNVRKVLPSTFCCGLQWRVLGGREEGM